MNYIKPYIAEYGNALNVVNGECGWGIENWTLDKTGGVNKTVFVNFFDIKESCLNMFCTTTYIRGCKWSTKCNGENDCTYL